MNRLAQDAADTLQGYEAQQAFRESERARWKRAQGQPITSVWTGALSKADKEYVDREVVAGNLSF